MGLLNPINLLYGASLLGLIAIYLRARSRPMLEVSSLMLFEEIPAPVARSRFLRVDALFWLELAALGALTLAIAGLYIRSAVPVGSHRTHALVFDLGAGMGALQNHATRLEQAQREALKMLADAPAGDEFSVVAYALEASAPLAGTSDRRAIKNAIEALQPLAVPAQPAALRAALIRARTASAIELFTDRPPQPEIIADAHTAATVAVHQVGRPADNLAIVSLDPGVPRASQGRCIIRNLSPNPMPAELVIEAGGHKVFDSSLMLEPRAQVMVPFGPVPNGGLVHAHLVGTDALAADNDRYAYAPNLATAHALVLSPDAATRDDLARILLAVNPNFIVTAADPSLRNAFDSATRYDFAILHDCSGLNVKASARLIVFPEPEFPGAKLQPLLDVTGTAALAEMTERVTSGPLRTPVLLGPSRVVALPGWLDPLAMGSAVGEPSPFPLAAAGADRNGPLGVITFDVRNHLLLDPDKMDALVLTVDTIRKLTEPLSPRIEPTGAVVTLATFGPARLIDPQGLKRDLVPDQWGRVRFQPLEAGRYELIAGDRSIAVYANYFDATESDLWPEPPPRSAAAVAPPLVSRTLPAVRPLAIFFTLLALIAFLTESTVLIERGRRWGAHSV